jgi:phage gp46-like protein
MAQNWDRDPITGDYLLQGGSPKQTDSLRIPAYNRLKVKRGTWLYAPDSSYGSDFYTISKRPTENANARLENIGLAALQPMLDDGRASEIDVTLTENQRSASFLKVDIVDAAGELETETFTGLGV